MKRRQYGITLIELMVVVAIIAILAAIAYPAYTDQVRKARRNDGRAALETIAQAQERFFTVNGSYVTATADIGSLNLPAYLTDGDSESRFYTLTLSPGGAGSPSFLATATATNEQAGDPGCTSMTLNQIGVRAGEGPDCW